MNIKIDLIRNRSNAYHFLNAMSSIEKQYDTDQLASISFIHTMNPCYNGLVVINGDYIYSRSVHLHV